MRRWIAMGALVVAACGGDGPCVLEAGLYETQTTRIDGNCVIPAGTDSMSIAIPDGVLPLSTWETVPGCRRTATEYSGDMCSRIWRDDCDDGSRLDGTTVWVSRTQAESVVSYTDTAVPCTGTEQIVWTKL